MPKEALAIMAVLVPITVGWVEGLKKMGLTARWAFLASVASGTAFFWLLNANLTWQWTVLGGILVGLSASGLYSGGRAMNGE